MNNMNYMNNWPMYSGNMWNRYGMQQRYNSYNYGKRSADAEPKAEAAAEPKAEAAAEPKAEAEAEAEPKAEADAEPDAEGYNWPMISGYMWYRPGMQGYSYHSYNYGKRSAEADAWYGPYGYPRYMSYMNRPYHYYGYRYHF